MDTQHTFTHSILRLAGLVALILCIPLVAMQFNQEVNWSAFDFIIMGLLLFSVGFAYLIVTRYMSNIVYKAAVAMALGSTFLMLWANLAVGLIGSGPHIGNWMYLAVLVVGLIGTILSRFQAAGMERTMYAMAFTFIVLASIALLTKMYNYPSSSVNEILGVNVLFAGLFTIAGLLFRQVALSKASKEHAGS